MIFRDKVATVSPDGNDSTITSEDHVVTYILRCHSISTLPKLKSALLSIAAQRYPSVTAFVALQNLHDADVAQVEKATRLLQQATGLQVDVCNFAFPSAGDFRGALLNRALECVESRFVGFLDYDDVIYPHHAEILIADLRASEEDAPVISFGGCVTAFYDDISDGAINITSKRAFANSASVSSCLVGNCFPIHTYIVDRDRLQHLPKFGESSNLMEDYFFLLEVLEHYPVSTRNAKLPLCEYRMNNDNSNTIAIESGSAVYDQKKIDKWNRVQEVVEQYKARRSFKLPYTEIMHFGDYTQLTRQPFLRGLFVCQVAKGIRKKRGELEASRFLRDPKGYSRTVLASERTLFMKIFF